MENPLWQRIAKITLRNLTHEGNVHCCVTAIQDKETFTRSNDVASPSSHSSQSGSYELMPEAGIAETCKRSVNQDWHRKTSEILFPPLLRGLATIENPAGMLLLTYPTALTE